MKYIMFICHEPDRLEAAIAEVERDAGGWEKEMADRGIRVAGQPLRPAAEATTVRVREGSALLTDGPFAETKETIAGFDLIDCANLDEAIEVARRHPCATVGSIELRPYWEE
jgi:hypothetical protein